MGFKITFKDIKAGKQFELDVEPQDTAQDLKRKIHSQEGILPEQQRLIFRGKTLQDGQTVAHYGIQKESMLHIVMRLKSSITLDFRTMTGKTITIEVQPSETVDAVKAMIQELVKLLADQHSLNFKGQLLAGDKPLSHYGIKDKDILHLILIALAVDETTPGSTEGPAFQPPPRIAHEAHVDALLRVSREETKEQGRLRVYGDLGTLYARCGGIFGVAGFVDRCMDKWMADATLNANAAVASWHQRAQRCGFKFLVTQLLGYITGGPQRYTGRSMADSHKHLNISANEWDSFMQVFHSVCKEFNLPQDETSDLAAILNSMEADCVVHLGEAVPENPGHKAPPGESLYARLGGVYPIALFVDRLVDALLADRRVNVPVDGQKRNEASLKYLFTEMVCRAVGGPEQITSTEYPETRLLLPDRMMFFLLEAAKAASDHFELSKHRVALILCLYEIKHLIVNPAKTVTISANQQDRQKKVKELGTSTGVQLLYIPRGGVVKLDFDATEEQMGKVAAGLAKLGFKTVEKTKVKSADEAAAGSMLSAETIAGRYAASGSFIAARMRVFGDPRTLYGRGGGIFGLAKLSDRLMDVWMADPVLNANMMVERWHQSAQKFGFKFLVTQIFGYLTGGPQRYTGQPMDVAHKHLGITMAQWSSFMAGLDKVMREFQIDNATQKDLKAIFDSFRDQCVVQEGEKAPPDPGLCRKPPTGNSLYAQAGGVYPLAQFTDAIVALALQGNRGVHIPRDPTNKRTPAGLKYLVTELVCSAAGGPQIVTSRGFDDAKLGVPVEEWPAFMQLVEEIAPTCWPNGAIQQSIKAVMEEQKVELCMGLATEDESAEAIGRRKLTAAGFGYVEATAAMEKSHGDPDKALELLQSGWTPENSAPSGTDNHPAAASGCPFLQSSAASAGSSGSSGAQHWRVLGSSLQEELDKLLYEDPDLICPITMVLTLDPVIASDGYIYERVAITELKNIKGASPMTHAPITDKFLDAPEHQARVRAFMEEKCRKLFHFAGNAFNKHRDESMALTALDRMKDYIAVLTPQAVPELARDFASLCQDLGRPAELGNPQERIQKTLKAQVAQAKMEAETVLGKAVPGSKVVVFCIDRSWEPIVGPSIRAINEIFTETLEGFDQVGLYQLGDPWIFELIEKGIKEDELREVIKKAAVTGGSTALYRSMHTCLEAIEQNLAQAPGAEPWLIVLTDTVDIDDSIFEDEKNKMDPELKRRLQKAGARVGEVTMSLMWHTTDDLDLHVKCPGGEHISYSTKKAGGGYLDVDMNPNHNTNEPVENVFWDKCPPGEYKVFVENFSYGGAHSAKGGSAIPFTLTLRTKVEVSGVTEFNKVWGMCTWTSQCKGIKDSSRQYFKFTVPKNGVEKEANTKVLDEVCSGLSKIAKSGLHLIMIDSRQISGWQPDNPRWPEWRSNIQKIVKTTQAAGGEAIHLSAANEAEISEKFGEIAEMMTD